MTHRQYFEFFTAMARRFHQRVAVGRESAKRATRGCAEKYANLCSFSSNGRNTFANRGSFRPSQA